MSEQKNSPGEIVTVVILCIVAVIVLFALAMSPRQDNDSTDKEGCTLILVGKSSMCV